MADDPKKFDFTQAINQLEEINAWFQHEDFTLDEGLHKLKQGKELIKKCRTRLHEVENEFVHIKQEFADEAQGQESEAVEDFPSGNGTTHKALNGEKVDPEDVPL
jgi:exodeoxyribonuclease VII small subunit